MSFNGWKKLKVNDICSKVTSGGTPSTRSLDYYGGSIPWLKTQEINFNRIYDTETKITEIGLKESAAKWIPEDSVIVAMYGATAGKIAINKIPLTTNQACCNLIINNEIADYQYVYYNLTSRFSEIASMAVGGAQQNLNSIMIRNLEIPIPPLPTQHRIADILSSLDDKIELNRQTNATLEAIAQAIFKEWFVDFNYPGATGEMQDSELGMIPQGWRVGVLEEIITNFDRKRVPLSSRERENRKGIFPYYGAASILDYVDDYLFEGVYLLMGEDGTVITEDEKPILQYVSGKFWVNNHTHVLQGKDPFSTEYVLMHLKNTNVNHIVTGAVQPKINQGNMNDLPVIIPEKLTLASFQDTIRPMFANILEIEQEISTLKGIRDALLPKLMSGEIEV